MVKFCSIFSCIFIGSACATLAGNIPDHSSLEHASKALGHMIWNEIDGLKDQDQIYMWIIEGMREAKAGKPAEHPEAFIVLEQVRFEEESTRNLQQAEQKLAFIKSKGTFKELVPNKLFIETVEKGRGTALKDQERASFTMRVEWGDGSVLIDTKDKPVIQDLREAISGFTQGVKGMRIGERRILYIHPDLGYGDFHSKHINQLIKADVRRVADSDCPCS